MVVVNVEEGLPARSGSPVRSLLPASSWLERPVALDGRMLVHEWVRTPRGILKLDAMDHHQDHFFPGCQDIAWDVAAALVEFDLDASGTAHLVNSYRRLSGDRTIASRLPHYTIAYLSFRLGYATLATGVLGQTDDAARFALLVRRYAELLGTKLSASSGG